MTGAFLDIIDKPSVTMPKEIDLVILLAPGSDLVTILGEYVDWTYPYIAYL